MTTTLTTPAVAEAIDQLIVERGEDYVYPADIDGCYYSFEDGTPACLVGAVIAKLDPAAFDQLVQIEAPIDDGNGGIRRRKAGAVGNIIARPRTDGLTPVNSVGLDADLVLFRALSDAQQVQDLSGTWSEARKRFVEVIQRDS